MGGNSPYTSRPAIITQTLPPVPTIVSEGPNSNYVQSFSGANNLEVELKLGFGDTFDVNSFFDRLTEDLINGGASISNIHKGNTTNHTFFYEEDKVSIYNGISSQPSYLFSTRDGKVKKAKSPTVKYTIENYVFSIREEVFSEIFPEEQKDLVTREVARTRSDFSLIHNNVGMFVCFDKCLCKRRFFQQLEIEIKSGNTRSTYGLHQSAKQVLDFVQYMYKMGLPVDSRPGIIKYEWAINI